MMTRHSLRWTLLAAALWATPLRADIYTLSIPHYSCNQGAVVMVPVNLDHAAGLAGMRVQINYDPQVLTLTELQPGPLGEQFDLSYEIADGAVTIDLVRANPLATGSGRLVLLRFFTNAGATTDLYSDLAIARFEISDESGVSELAATHTLAVVGGSVAVSLSGNIDNESNGVPDWWEEQYGLDLFTPAAGRDSDGDGRIDLLEYAYGGNPLLFDLETTRHFSDVVEVEGLPYLTLTFPRRKSPSAVTYLLEESTDLMGWASLDPDSRLVAPPTDLGNGMERVTVRGQYPIGSPQAPDKSFMRITVPGP